MFDPKYAMLIDSMDYTQTSTEIARECDLWFLYLHRSMCMNDSSFKAWCTRVEAEKFQQCTWCKKLHYGRFNTRRHLVCEIEILRKLLESKDH